jgi:hypothetical protein
MMTRAIDQVPDHGKLDFLANELRDRPIGWVAPIRICG